LAYKILVVFLILVLGSISLVSQSSFDVSTHEIKLINVHKNTAVIDVHNLIVGQSGIVVHKTDNRSLIISHAIVTSILNNKSILTLYDLDNLKQNALPIPNLKPQIGDIFVLNHMYHSSLLIVPNFETFQKIKDLYPKQIFFNPDIFASNLKIINTPLPKIQDIKKFCISYDIGTVFIVISNKLYILDSHSFKILNVSELDLLDTTTQSPFFTKVIDIKKEFWDFGEDKIRNYNKYYKNLIKDIK